MKPLTVDGKAQEGTVIVPISFSCDGCTAYIAQLPKSATFPVFLEPTWLAAPSFEQWKAAYPVSAQKDGVFGAATVQCFIQPKGQLRTCQVTTENPQGRGFGGAAKKLSPLFQIDPINADGTSRKGAAAVFTVAWTAESLAKTGPSGVPVMTVAIPREKIDAVYPKAALESDFKQGKATVNCDLVANGTTSNCSVRSETPASLGFGESALALTPHMRFNLWTKEGLPPVRRISIPMSFGDPSLETVSLQILSRIVERLVQTGRSDDAKAVAEVIKRRFPNDPAAERALGLAAYVPNKR
jgi:hypothetical protein